MKKLFACFLALLCNVHVNAQDVCGQRISLLTCAPGAELYSTFGHTAIRVQDTIAGTDLVFNYGTFEFGPDFYTKFIRGKLNYFLSVEEFPSFLSLYQFESRSVTEQELNLSCAEKQKLYSALQVNARPENRYYKYDFLFDNCTTRAGDIVQANAAQPVVIKGSFIDGRPSFRDLIHQYLDAGNQHWSKFGIDFLLGAKLDRTATVKQTMFLPDNLMHGFDNMMTGDHKLVANEKVILNMPSPLRKSAGFTPMIAFSILLAILIVLSFLRNPVVIRLLPVFDFIFFFLVGLAGLAALFMWFFTDHVVCRNNYNLLWALPTHVAGAFFVNNRKRWTNYYWLVTIILQAILLISWIFLPQRLNLAVLPLVLIILLRAWLFILKPHYAKPEDQN